MKPAGGTASGSQRGLFKKAPLETPKTLWFGVSYASGFKWEDLAACSRRSNAKAREGINFGIALQ